jgi:hypothetical protein
MKLAGIIILAAVALGGYATAHGDPVVATASGRPEVTVKSSAAAVKNALINKMEGAGYATSSLQHKQAD